MSFPSQGLPVPTEGPDSLYGDSVDGLGGNDTIEGDQRDDTLFGGAGDDVFRLFFGDYDSIDGGDGFDVVQSDLQVEISTAISFTSIERLEFTGYYAQFWVKASQITDENGNNLLQIVGYDDEHSQNQIAIYNDRGYLALSKLTLTQWHDTNAIWTFGAPGNDTIISTRYHDGIMGFDGDDLLIGGVDDNALVGKAGADTMIGGKGDDTYSVEDAGDVVKENGGGHDVVYSAVSFSLAGQGLEDLYLNGPSDIDATGNHYANHLGGNAGANLLDGAAGADTMEGGAATTPMSSTTQATGSSRPGAASTLYAAPSTSLWRASRSRT